MSARVYCFKTRREIVLSKPEPEPKTPRLKKPKGYTRALELLDELQDTTEVSIDHWLDVSNEFHAIVTTPSGHDFSIILDFHNRNTLERYKHAHRVSLASIDHLADEIEAADRAGLTSIILTK